MRINLESIPEEGLKIEEQELSDILTVEDKDIKFNVPVNVSVSANLVSGTLLVKGKLETKVSLTCSRCLKKFDKPLIGKDFSFDLDVKGQTEVDITDNVREGIILLLPVKPLCKKDCRGICPKCGQNLNEKECGCDRSQEDIRWSELDKLKLNKKVKN